MIFKINTGWTQTVDRNKILGSFGDAWNCILNALDGAWGTISYSIDGSGDPSASVDATVLRGQWKVEWETTKIGSVTLRFPCECNGPSVVTIREIDNNGLVTATSEYVLGRAATGVTVVLPTGNKYIAMSGSGRRF